MAYDVAGDIRLDPRLKAILAGIPVRPAGDVDSRETLLAEANSEAARQRAELLRSFMDLCDTEDAAPSAGLRVHTEKVVSEPDGNTINLQVIRPIMTRRSPASITSTAAAWRRCRATTACTAAGARSSRLTAWPS